MTPTLRGTPVHGDQYNGASGTAPLTINTPAGVQAGDVLIAAVVSSLSPSTPAGWALSRQSSNDQAGHFTTFYRVATASEPASHGFSSVGASAAGTISAFSGVDNGAPVNASATPTGSSTRVTSLTSPSVTTTVDNALVLRLFGVEGNSGRTVTPPANHTEIYDRMIQPSIGLDYIGGEASHLTQATAGSTGTATATASGNVAYNAHTIALAPGAPPLVIPDLVGAVTG